MLRELVVFVGAHWRDAVEIGLLWLGVHLLWVRLRQTREARLLVGVGSAAVAVIGLTHLLHLPALEWLLQNATTLGLFMLVVIFQPELRRMATALGNHRFFANQSEGVDDVEQLAEITFELANRQLGALIAIEGEMSLDRWIENGVAIDALLSTELVVSLFFPRTPLHDGGLILRAGRVAAGACIFPLTDRTDIDRNLGLRHRAAIGLAEETDALLIVVSEETGIVSLCHHGSIERGLDPASLRTRLAQLLSGSSDEKPA